MDTITLKNFNKLYEEGKLMITPSQYNITLDPIAAQRMVYSLRTTKKAKSISTPGFTKVIGVPSYGKSRTRLAYYNNVYYIINDASEVVTALKLFNGKNIPNGYVCDDPEMATYFKKISKGQKGMSTKNLPASTVKKLGNLVLGFDIVEANSLEEIISMRKKAFGLLTASQKIIITNEYTLFFNMFYELAHQLRYNKGNKENHLPSYWSSLQKNVQNAYFEVAKNINKTNISEGGILRMLLLTINCASYVNRKDKFGVVNTYNAICEEHISDSKVKCIDMISNTLLNLSIAPKLLDEARLAHPMLWIGCVYNFGQFSTTSAIGKKKKHKTIKIDNKTITKKRPYFNNALELCLTGHKNTFEKSDLVICSDPSKEGSVFNMETVDYNIHEISNLYVTAEVIKAIYNEI